LLTILYRMTFSNTFLLFLIAVFSVSTASAQQLSLKVAGTDTSGFHVDIYSDGKLLVTNTEEFSIQLYNLDLSTVAEFPHWTGQEWTAGEKSVTLKRTSYIPEFDARLSVTVCYEIINAGMVKKTVFMKCFRLLDL